MHLLNAQKLFIEWTFQFYYIYIFELMDLRLQQGKDNIFKITHWRIWLKENGLYLWIIMCLLSLKWKRKWKH